MGKLRNKAKTNVTADAFDEEKLRESIMIEARALGLPAGSMRPIASQVAKKVADWVSIRPMVTDLDLNQRIALEMKKYNEDLAYVYQNRGKII